MAKNIFAASKPEHILCAAIWYPDDRAEHIVHRPTNIEKGIVVCGHRHHVIINQYYDMTLKKTSQVKNVQGFLTSKNRFVDRQEAFTIAHKTGQIMRQQIVRDRASLYSEDLY